MKTYPTGVTQADGKNVTPNAYRFFSWSDEADKILKIASPTFSGVKIIDESMGAQPGFEPGGVGIAYVSPDGSPKIYQLRGQTSDGLNINENVADLICRQKQPGIGDVTGGTSFRSQKISDTDAEIHWTK